MIELLEKVTGCRVEVSVFRLPCDLQDKFTAAGWRRPQACLDDGVQASMSAFALADRRAVDDGLRRLERDLRSGAWRERYGSLLELESFDAGYKFLSTGR